MKRFVGRERESERVVLGCLLAIMANKYIDVFREKKGLITTRSSDEPPGKLIRVAFIRI